MVAPVGGFSPRVFASLPAESIAHAPAPRGGAGRPLGEPTTVNQALKQIFGTSTVPVLKHSLLGEVGSSDMRGSPSCAADPVRLVLLARIHQASSARLSPEERQLSWVGQRLLGWQDVDAKNAKLQADAVRLIAALDKTDRCVPPGSQTSLQGAVDSFIQTNRRLLLR